VPASRRGASCHRVTEDPRARSHVPAVAPLVAIVALALLALAPAAQAEDWSLLDTAPQYHQSVDEPDDVELGVKFSVPTASSSGDYWVDAVEFWQEKGMKTDRVWIYDDTGAIVAQGIKTAPEPLTGEVRVALDAALKLRIGVTYTASYRSDGAYLAMGGVFAPNIIHGPLRFGQNAGVYRYGSGAGIPLASWAAASYYVSPVVMLRSR
jgi:hypothetical protein